MKSAIDMLRLSLLLLAWCAVGGFGRACQDNVLASLHHAKVAVVDGAELPGDGKWGNGRW